MKTTQETNTEVNKMQTFLEKSKEIFLDFCVTVSAVGLHYLLYLYIMNNVISDYEHIHLIKEFINELNEYTKIFIMYFGLFFLTFLRNLALRFSFVFIFIFSLLFAYSTLFYIIIFDNFIRSIFIQAFSDFSLLIK